jgi:hypothetical protein
MKKDAPTDLNGGYSGEPLSSFQLVERKGSPTRFAASLAAAWTLFGIGGCGGEPSAVANDIEGLPVLTVRERLRIGSLEDPDVGFSQIRSVDVDREGRIYVQESLDVNIRVYDRDGTHLRTIGGRGEGPGEFRMIGGFGVTGDKVWTSDVMLERLTVFDTAGEVLSTGRIEGVPVALQDRESTGYVIPSSLRADGLFMGRMNRFGRRVGTGQNGVGPLDTVQVPRIRFDPSGEPEDTIGWDPYPPPVPRPFKEVEVGSTRYRVPRPPSDQPARVNLAESQWVVERPLAVSEEVGFFRVTRIDDAQDTLFSREYRYKPKEYSPEALDLMAFGGTPMPAVFSPSGSPSPSGGAGLRAIQEAIRDAMDFPRFQPPIQQLRGGEDGTLWLRREDIGGATHRWLVVGADGDPRGFVEIPRQNLLRWVSEEEFIVAEPDGVDVPWLVCWRIES